MGKLLHCRVLTKEFPYPPGKWPYLGFQNYYRQVTAMSFPCLLMVIIYSMCMAKWQINSSLDFHEPYLDLIKVFLLLRDPARRAGYNDLMGLWVVSLGKGECLHVQKKE